MSHKSTESAFSGSPQAPGHLDRYVALVGISAVGCGVASLFAGGVPDLARFMVYLALAAVTSTWKIQLPKLEGTMSVNFVVLLVAMPDSTATELLVIASACGLIQTFWRPKVRPLAAQAVFNPACLVLSVAAATAASRSLPAEYGVIAPALAALVLYVANSILIAGLLCILESAPVWRVWRACYFWSFAYYMMGGAAALLILRTTQVSKLFSAPLVLALMAMIYVSYKMQLQRSADQQPVRSA